jgi:protein-S-isoprenylcysteine O-methyltransferase Ste14
MRQVIVLLKTLFMAVCAVVIFGAITRQLRGFDQFIPVTLPSWMAVGGIILMGTGAILAFTCFGLFAASGALTPGPAFPDPGVLISRGPYRYVRNPMAKGGLTVLAGWGFYQLSPSILLFAVLIAGLMHLFVVYAEEPKLERRFGQSYRDYTSRVGRWLPTRRALAHSLSSHAAQQTHAADGRFNSKGA